MQNLGHYIDYQASQRGSFLFFCSTDGLKSSWTTNLEVLLLFFISFIFIFLNKQNVITMFCLTGYHA